MGLPCMRAVAAEVVVIVHWDGFVRSKITRHKASLPLRRQHVCALARTRWREHPGTVK